MTIQMEWAQAEIRILDLISPPKLLAGHPAEPIVTRLSTHFLLPAGSYSLLAGSGLFGATGAGFSLRTNVAENTQGLFFWQLGNRRFSNGFLNDPSLRTQFSIEGDAVDGVPAPAPEPGTLALLATGGLPLLGFWRRRRQSVEAETF